MLSQRGVDWAWYAGGWDVALAGHANDAQFPSRPNFQPHHQPLNYFVQFAPGTAARARHFRDGRLGETARTNKFLAHVEAGTLPPDNFLKQHDNPNLHPGYPSVAARDRHIGGVSHPLHT